VGSRDHGVGSHGSALRPGHDLKTVSAVDSVAVPGTPAAAQGMGRRAAEPATAELGRAAQRTASLATAAAEATKSRRTTTTTVVAAGTVGVPVDPIVYETIMTAPAGQAA
jgi:hypothetical protein